jgi:hypothetical protein
VQPQTAKEGFRVEFNSLNCSSCQQTIRGSAFWCSEGCRVDEPVNGDSESNFCGDPPPLVLCEACGRQSFHPTEHLTKFAKHCVLAEASSVTGTSLMCSCNQSDSASAKYPFTKLERDEHLQTCELRQLMQKHMKARTDDLLVCKEVSQNRDDSTLKDNSKSGIRAHLSRWNSGSSSNNQHKNLPTHKRTNSESTSKSLLRKIIRPAASIAATRVRYGNVHMALSFGPIVIENGAPE